jgi:hypothetical protein
LRSAWVAQAAPNQVQKAVRMMGASFSKGTIRGFYDPA